MSSWHTQSPIGLSPSRFSPPSSLSIRSSSSPDPQSILSAIEDSSLHGVPLIASSESAYLHADSRARHSRSYSHPFPTIFSKARISADRPQTKQNGVFIDRSTNQNGYILPGAREKPRLQQQASLNADLIKGRCATCDTLVRWPKDLTVFRCTVCLMINDLRSSNQGQLDHLSVENINERHSFSNPRAKVSPHYRGKSVIHSLWTSS